MKFKFCGDLDAPDFLLKEIDTLSKISVVRIKLIVAQVVKGILGEQIDFAKVENLLSKSNLSTGDVKGSVAGIDFILKSGCKYNVDDETLSLELNQLGLPKEHCEAFSKVYSQKKDALQTKLKSETLKLTRLDSSKPVDWRVDYVLASSAKSKIDAAVANVQLNLTTPNGEQQTIAFEADQAQFRVLLSELRDAQAVMESVAAP